MKQRVLREIDARVQPDAVLASNTSSLSINEMSASLQRPQNFVGMHFFNPVPVIPLVEVVRGPATGDVAAVTAVGLAARLGQDA